MTHQTVRTFLFFIAALIFAIQARAQTATYHLHHEFTTRVSVAYQLKPAGPDAAAIAHSTQNLKNFAPGEYNISWWETQPGVPNAAGIIPAGSTITFTLWMKKTFNNGTMYPRAKLYLQTSTGNTLLCTATGSTALTTTLAQYTLSCTTSSPISMATADYYSIWVGVNLTVGPGNKNVQAEVDIEGTLNGNYDSRIVVPLPVPPSISGISPTSGAVGTSVTVSGSNFGATQGSNTIKFNGTTATPTSWSATSIVAPVPSGATTGPVVVTVGGASSNGVTFTVLTTGAIAGTITKYDDGTPLNGALVEALQSSTVIASTTSTTNGSYSVGSLAPGTYDVRVSATGYATHLSTGISVVAGGTSTLNVAVVPQPAITNVAPASGIVGTAIAVTGLNFGATQGTSTITFNGVASTPSSWGASSIVVPVPAGATTGPVVVTVAGALSNSVSFTVLFTGGITGTISHAGDSAPIAGALIEAIQSGAVKASANSAANGTYSISNLVQGAYDVRASASGYVTKLTIGIAVPPNATATVNAALSRPGTISGKVTQLDGTTPIVGAGVEVSQGTTTAGTATTNATGDYSVAGLHPGTYSVQASAIGYKTQNLAAVAVSEDTTTTTNFSLNVAPPSAGISYIYDKLGRLIAAVDLSGDTARYSYDEVGNLLSISRFLSSQVSIIEFTPASGTASAPVTIYGTGFSATPSQNAVTFNGVAASVTSATTTQIVTSVPSGAATGPIAVTSPSGSATSSTPFTVAGSSGAPTITGFNPTVGTAGTAVTITGTNFEADPTSNKVRFNIGNALVISATTSSISSAVPPAKAASGPISVATPVGKAVGGDFFIPPSPYTAADVEVTGRMAIGESRVVTISAANKIGLIVFDGTEGQRLSVYESHSFSQGCETLRVSILKPDGIELTYSAGCFGSALIEPISLPVTGTYTLVVDPLGTLTGQATINLYNVVDITGPISPGGSAVSVNITTPGQRALYSFSGTFGQRVSAYESHSFSQACESLRISIQKPDGTELAAAAGCFGASFIEPVSLPVTGIYTFIVDMSGANTGQATVNLYDVVDITGPVIPGGPALNVNITSPGQRALYSFNGNTGQRMSAYESHSFSQACESVRISIQKPDGTELTAAAGCFGASFIEPVDLPVTGTYTLIVDLNGAFTGQVNANLYDVVDITGTITADGPPVNLNIATPGQRALLTFSGTNGQNVRADVSHQMSQACGVVVPLILKPDGTQLISGGGCFGIASVGPVTLPVTGTYTLVIDPTGASNGTATVTFYNVVGSLFKIKRWPAKANIAVTRPNARASFYNEYFQGSIFVGSDNLTGSLPLRTHHKDPGYLKSAGLNLPSWPQSWPLIRRTPFQSGSNRSETYKQELSFTSR